MKDILHIDDMDAESCMTSFRTIANTLMNKYLLRVRDSYYRIVDCEFYYCSSTHNDPYAHSHEHPGNSYGEWYFHGSGMDITLTTDHSFGGILIRGIAPLSDTGHIPTRNGAIAGPLKVCTEIFKQFGSILREDPLHFGLADIFSVPTFGLTRQARLFAVPRVGLNNSKDNEDNYGGRPYRFLSFLYLPHKESEKVRKYLLHHWDDPISPIEYEAFSTGRTW
ncbi:DNA-3-methyladenine glycosylase [Chitinophaga qingshengii]|uniref:DNA-3-methyladenine glycosylase n=1 Tax=Chitinophaga qingshengii TaxID=1569794 RepID=A0ABR7TTE5_9BACT|nr:DNA-3-methyladenine glycosylase [Chitinophaga qingshengii]MBC9932892.1 DNA-3-methyladenine glycosylase [Chitinophaga qingshengii]